MWEKEGMHADGASGVPDMEYSDCFMRFYGLAIEHNSICRVVPRYNK